MPARTKSRAKFDFRGRAFVWWVDGEKLLRISSLDKKFVVAYPLLAGQGCSLSVEVIGVEFDRSDDLRRPLSVPAPILSSASMGAIVNELLIWAFGKADET